MGIPHLEDLTIGEVLSALDLKWEITEKLDGSYFEFGLDESGNFFSKRKGGKQCHDVTDWENVCWTLSFQIAHRVAENFIDCLVAENLIEAGDMFGSEILMGNQPNTVPYYHVTAQQDGTIFVSSYPHRIRNVPWTVQAIQEYMDNFKTTFSHKGLISDDGVDIIPTLFIVSWGVSKIKVLSQPRLQTLMAPSTTSFKNLLTSWSLSPSKVDGFTIRECLEVNLNKKSNKGGQRIWADLKAELKAERNLLRAELKCHLMMFKQILANNFLVSASNGPLKGGSDTEGFVVNAYNANLIFKVTNRDHFAKANHFTHMVKYWLIGGRRPNRPSFWSRTVDWSVEKRLVRLDALRIRYLSNRMRLKVTVKFTSHHGRYTVLRYDDELHGRVLNLFADTRQRIINGR